jgi:hypothetical protein
MTPEEEAEWFAKNAGPFPDGWYPDDDEFSSDLIALFVTGDVPVEVCTFPILICSRKTVLTSNPVRQERPPRKRTRDGLQEDSSGRYARPIARLEEKDRSLQTHRWPFRPVQTGGLHMAVECLWLSARLRHRRE